MIRESAVAILRAAYWLYFDAIRFNHPERIPPDGPVIFVMNHPNGLVDPVLLLSHLPRVISFLAKEPLFEIPVIGYLTRAFDSIPIYRSQDSQGVSRIANRKKNTGTFEVAARVLRQGGAVAIFPEGVSHASPGLIPLKSGAARIALGTAMPGLRIVPLWVSYLPRSEMGCVIELTVGEPFLVPLTELNPVQAYREQIRALTAQMREGLGKLESENSENKALESRRGNSAERIRPGKTGLRNFLRLMVWPARLFARWLSVRLAQGETDLHATYEILALTVFVPMWALVLMSIAYFW